jgi:hypothetical protein
LKLVGEWPRHHDRNPPHNASASVLFKEPGAEVVRKSLQHRQYKASRYEVYQTLLSIAPLGHALFRGRGLILSLYIGCEHAILAQSVKIASNILALTVSYDPTALCTSAATAPVDERRGKNFKRKRAQERVGRGRML